MTGIQASHRRCCSG